MSEIYRRRKVILNLIAKGVNTHSELARQVNMSRRGVVYDCNALLIENKIKTTNRDGCAITYALFEHE